MHVLSIHMNAIPTVSLSEEWKFLCGLNWSQESPGKRQKSLVARSSQVPILLQDPVTLMIHFNLSLPVNVERGE